MIYPSLLRRDNGGITEKTPKELRRQSEAKKIKIQHISLKKCTFHKKSAFFLYFFLHTDNF